MYEDSCTYIFIQPICVDVSISIYNIYLCGMCVCVYMYIYFIYVYMSVQRHIRVLMSDSLAIDIGEDIEGETEKDERAD